MSTQIPFFSLKRQYDKHKSSFQDAINEVLKKQLFIGGDFVKNFEKKFGAYVGAKHVKSCNSGTDALWLALKALKLQKNDIVLTTPFSFIASSSEVISLGGHTAFIDIEEDSFNISPDKLEIWLNANTTMKDGITVHNETEYPVKGIIAVNIFGQVANFKRINEIANAWNLWVVEDAAQSVGSHVDGKKSGTFGDIATFSFYPTKNMGAFGDAGCVVTNNDELASRVEMLRNHGRFEKYDYREYGINSRMDAIQANILSTKLDFIDELNDRRREIATIYLSKLKGLLRLPKEVNGSHTYHQFCVQLEHRDELMNSLNASGIGSVVFYPKALNTLPFLQTDSRLLENCPIAERVSDNIMSLPVWPELTDKEVNTICSVVLDTLTVKQSEATSSVAL